MKEAGHYPSMGVTWVKDQAQCGFRNLSAMEMKPDWISVKMLLGTIMITPVLTTSRMCLSSVMIRCVPY